MKGPFLIKRMNNDYKRVIVKNGIKNVRSIDGIDGLQKDSQNE